MEFNNVIMFSEQSKDLYDAIKEFANESVRERKGEKAFATHSKDEMKKLINKAYMAEISRVSGMEVPTNRTELARFCNKQAIQEFAAETRDVMIDAILPIVLMQSPIQYISDIKYADFGDTIKFTIKSNQLLTVSKAGNRKRRTNVQKTFASDVTMVGENHQLTVGTNLYDVLIDRDYIAEEVMKSALAIETDILFSVYDAFVEATDALSNALAVTNYSESSLMTLCETVQAYNNGAKPIIIGTPVALKRKEFISTLCI